MSRVRLVWSEVKAALYRGHSLKAVHQCLADAGLDITCRRLSQCVGRLRREEKLRASLPKTAEKIHSGPNSLAPSLKPNRNSSPIDPPEERVRARSTAYDPMADFRDRRARAKTFEFEPGPPDESKLI
jgi:hypothetical protein